MIFFDLDDTLMDFKASEYMGKIAFYNQFSKQLKHTEEEFLEAWERIGKYHYDLFLQGKLSFDQQRINRIIDIFDGTDMDIHPDHAIDYFDIYLTHYKDNWKLFDDVIPCLEKLREYRLGIISNGNSVQQREKLKKLGIDDYFQVVMISSDIGISKPNPEIFIQACKNAQVQPEECIFIGDNLGVDILGCEKVNMNGIWLNRRNTDSTHKRTIRSLLDLKIDFEGSFREVDDIS